MESPSYIPPDAQEIALKDGDVITSEQAEKLKPTYESVIKFLGLENHPLLFGREKLFIEAITRKIKVKHEPSLTKDYKDGTYVYEGTITGLEDTVLDQKLRDLVYPVDEEGVTNHLDFDTVIGTILPDKSKLKSLQGYALEAVLKGNFLTQAVEGKGTCIDFSLVSLLLSKVYYPQSEATLLPYSFKKTGKKGKAATLLGHEHYGLYFKDKDGAPRVGMYGGFSIPLDILTERSEFYREGPYKGMRKKMADFIIEHSEKDVNPEVVRSAAVNLLALSQTVRSLEKTGYLHSNVPDTLETYQEMDLIGETADLNIEAIGKNVTDQSPLPENGPIMIPA